MNAISKAYSRPRLIRKVFLSADFLQIRRFEIVQAFLHGRDRTYSGVFKFCQFELHWYNYSHPSSETQTQHKQIRKIFINTFHLNNKNLKTRFVPTRQKDTQFKTYTETRNPLKRQIRIKRLQLLHLALFLKCLIWFRSTFQCGFHNA